ncbi:hypothetical protein [Bacillus sp. SJS]|uniref:hypothetical protein n=1 Tax=Bacillus sp. SJS TaxID=1423321 RepID=UPI0018D39C25|nr:hypothetical protein [Bacillus sp. SJS]
MLFVLSKAGVLATLCEAAVAVCLWILSSQYISPADMLAADTIAVRMRAVFFKGLINF